MISLRNPSELFCEGFLPSFEALLSSPCPRRIEFEERVENPPWVDEPNDEYVNEEPYENLFSVFIASLRIFCEKLLMVIPFLGSGTGGTPLALKLNSLLKGLLVEAFSMLPCWAPDSWAWSEVSFAWAVVGNPVLRPISWEKESLSLNALLAFLFLNRMNQTTRAHTRMPPTPPTTLPTMVPVFDFEVPWFWLLSKLPSSQCW